MKTATESFLEKLRTTPSAEDPTSPKSFGGRPIAPAPPAVAPPPPPPQFFSPPAAPQFQQSAPPQFFPLPTTSSTPRRGLWDGLSDVEVFERPKPLSPTSESPLEEALLAGLTSHFPHPYSGRVGPLGVLIPQLCVGGYRADFAIINGEKGILVEVDGHEFHSTPEQKENDAKRDRKLLRLGWVTVRFTGKEIHKDPTGCVNEILTLMRKLSE